MSIERFLTLWLAAKIGDCSCVLQSKLTSFSHSEKNTLGISVIIYRVSAVPWFLMGLPAAALLAFTAGITDLLSVDLLFECSSQVLKICLVLASYTDRLATVAASKQRPWVFLSPISCP